jgi:hypothetical protein
MTAVIPIRSDDARSLRDRLTAIEAERTGLVERARPLQQRIAALECERDEINRKLAALNNTSAIRVSDHAIIRFLERKHGFDFEALRREILTPSRVLAIKSGAKAIDHDGVSFKVADGTITTVIEK